MSITAYNAHVLYDENNFPYNGLILPAFDPGDGGRPRKKKVVTYEESVSELLAKIDATIERLMFGEPVKATLDRDLSRAASLVNTQHQKDNLERLKQKLHLYWINFLLLIL